MRQTPARAFDLPIYNNFVPQKFIIQKFLMTSLPVVFGLAPPPIKNPGYAYGLGDLYNF